MDLEKMTIKELKAMAKEMGVEFNSRVKKEELIKLLSPKEIKAADEEGKEITKDTVIDEDLTIPNGFIPREVKLVKKEGLNGVKDGRIYKVLANGIGMYADNGETFKL